jgi:outer membrane protein assembly factor BamD (BamD/ComL family)
MDSSRLIPLQPAISCRIWRVALVLFAVAVCTLAASPVHAEWPWSGWFGQEAPVGTPEWWKKHEYKDAELVPGKGYEVPGTEGYFDAKGRPIDRPVANTQIPRPDGMPDPDVGLLPGLDPKVTYGKVKNAVGLGPNDQVAHADLEEAERLFQQKKYRQAAKKYKEAADRAIDMRLKEDALFMTAESYFFADRYIKARDAYNELASQYPSTRYLDRLIDREWNIAQYWEKYEDHSPDWPMTPNAWDRTRPWFDTVGHAIKTYENIRMNDPTGPRADDAVMATAGIYFRRGRYDDADYNYGLLRSEYPRSEFQFEAHLLGLQSKLRKYQGADYDGTPLEEAQDLVKQLRTNFAGQLSAEERERLTVQSAQLNQELASRTMRMAQYYDGTKYYASARGYYAEVIRKYPDSELAQEAKERLAKIADEPDQPPKRLAWLVERFPKSEEHTSLARIPEVKNGTLVARAPDNASGNDGVQPASATTVR